MAEDGDRPGAAEKGKGKVDNIADEKRKRDANPEKDGKPTANGKVVDGLPEGKQAQEEPNLYKYRELTFYDQTSLTRRMHS